MQYALRCFAHFDHVDFSCLEKLIKQTIIKAQTFNTQTLAVVLNSLADLDIHNPTLLTISKELIIQKFDEGQLASEQGLTIEGPPLNKDTKDELRPLSCAQFMTAFARAKMFSEV